MAAPMNHNKQHVTDMDNFKPVFKYFKQRQSTPDLSHVIDFNSTSNEKVKKRPLQSTSMTTEVGFVKGDNWEAYTYDGFPGFTFIRNPFLDGVQWYWIRRCLEKYPCNPNITNLDAHMKFDEDFNMWDHSRAEREKMAVDEMLLWKLRWTTLGYHHDWNTKKYCLDNITPVPADLQSLSQYIAGVLGWPKYQAEAVIVNYYHSDSTLAGHTDHSEIDHQAPLISVSFGQTALFMLGGPTKETKPITMFVRSGDIIVMEGPARLSYHAVPKVFSDSCDFTSNLWQVPDWRTLGCAGLDSAGIVNHLQNENLLDTFDYSLYKEYLSKSRINMNVRQVNPTEGQQMMS